MTNKFEIAWQRNAAGQNTADGTQAGSERWWRSVSPPAFAAGWDAAVQSLTGISVVRSDQKTVKVRIAVAVDSDGGWRASETAIEPLEAGDAKHYWMTAEIPIPERPEIPEIEAEVTPA